MKEQLITTLLFLLSLIWLGVGCNTTSPDLTPTPAENQAEAPIAEAEIVSIDPNKLTIFHHFYSSTGLDAINAVINEFEQTNPNIALESKDFQGFYQVLPSYLQQDQPPNVFSYWAGARAQDAVNSGKVASIETLWAEHNLDEVFPPAIAGASTYKGEKYFIPIGYHYIAFFYNKDLFEQVGVAPPQTWDDLIAVAETFKQAGIPAFALGSQDHWPTQLWFDYLLLRTAGPDYRQALMEGKHPYTSPEVRRVFEMWKALLDAGYFVSDPNTYSWWDSGDMVAEKRAAMILMGTWIKGYYVSNDLMTPGEDYDYFPPPPIDPDVPIVAQGGIDGFLMTDSSPGRNEEARQFLLFFTQPDTQETWTKAQGALPPNIQVDPDGYDPLTQRVLQDVQQAEVFAFSYDLSTIPPMGQAGVRAFSNFVAAPNDYENIMDGLEQNRREFFNQ